MATVLLIDNYDSFTYNLAHLIGGLGADVIVRRNDAIDAAAARAMGPDAIVISSGPGSPASAGVSTSIVRELGADVPILGLGLGHQCIAEAFGGHVVRAG